MQSSREESASSHPKRFYWPVDTTRGAAMFRSGVGCICIAAAVWAAGDKAHAQVSCLAGRGGSSTAQGAVIGSMLGALLGGAASGQNDRSRNILRGAIVGGALGGAAGCWTAHQQAIAAAREDSLTASAAQLEQTNAQLRAHNEELAQKIVDLRQAIAQEQRTAAGLSANVASLSNFVASEKQHAREELAYASDAISHINAALAQIGSYDQRYAGLVEQRSQLFIARGRLIELLSLQA